MAANPPNRTTIDLADMRERIEAYSSSPAWRELSLGGKCRSLMLEMLELREAQQLALNPPNDSEGVAQRAKSYLRAILMSEAVDIGDVARLANDLDIETAKLAALLKTQKGKVTNGH